MDATFDDDQQALRRAAADLARGGLEHARRMRDGGGVPAEPTASLFGGFAGLGTRAAESVGGTLVDAGIVLRELGRTVTPTPWVSHLLALHTAEAAGLGVAPGLADGARWSVTGGSRLLRDAASTTHVVVVDGRDVHLCQVTDVESTPTRPLDLSRPSRHASWGSPLASGRHDEPLRRARVLLAAELTGVGEGAVAAASAYAKQREQFGQPIGIFQGVAHQLAEAWTALELAWSLVLYACWGLDEGAADAAEAASAASAAAIDAAIFACERSMQVHGGIGITWEGDSHLWLRRALDDEAWLGSSEDRHDEVGRAVLSAARPA